MIQVAVMGYGTVGSGVVEVIEKNKEEINKKSNEALNIKYILDLRDFHKTALPWDAEFFREIRMKTRLSMM